jgi:hypothetical protein
MCDSGGAYGRNWERNQGKDFLAMAPSTLEVREYKGKAEISVTHNVFHWLRDRLEYDAKLTAAFRRFGKKAVNSDLYEMDLMQQFAKLKHSDNCDRVQVVNTYNGEDMLSQTLQYVTFNMDYEEYVLLQIHGGCDVRGGYTFARVFRVMEPYAMYDNAKGSVWEDKTSVHAQDSIPGLPKQDNDAYWQTDDSCHWYRDGSCGYGALAQLETYDVTHDFEEKGCGKIYLDDDGVAYGPVFGGRLSAGF